MKWIARCYAGARHFGCSHGKCVHCSINSPSILCAHSGLRIKNCIAQTHSKLTGSLRQRTSARLPFTLVEKMCLMYIQLTPPYPAGASWAYRVWFSLSGVTLSTTHFSLPFSAVSGVSMQESLRLDADADADNSTGSALEVSKYTASSGWYTIYKFWESYKHCVRRLAGR